MHTVSLKFHHFSLCPGFFRYGRSIYQDGCLALYKKAKNIEKSTHGKIRYSEIDNREKKAENSIDR
jgi:hypothetical protein